MAGLMQWLQQLQFGNLFEILLIAAASLLCITVHETCHGLVAYWLGDDTAKRQGRLTLNPLRHIDVAGLIMMVIARFGWAKPVPVNMNRFKSPKLGMALTALAGPVSNVILMILAALLRVVMILLLQFTQITMLEYAVMFFEYAVVLSAGLAVFNLFPIPPLDGSKVLFSLLPDAVYVKLMRSERYGMILLIIALFTNILDVPLLYLRGMLLQLVDLITEPVYYFVAEVFLRQVWKNHGII